MQSSEIKNAVSESNPAWADDRPLFEKVFQTRRQPLPITIGSGALGIVIGVLLVAVAARVQIPLGPVPITLQSLAVLLIAGILGAKLGAITMLTYLLAGCVGFPVFASGSGLAYVMGQTGGYLLGFVLAAILVGHLAQNGWCQTIHNSLVVTLAGTAMIMLMGLIWLSLQSGSLTENMNKGLWAHLPGGILKSVVAAVLLCGLSRIVREKKSWAPETPK